MSRGKCRDHRTDYRPFHRVPVGIARLPVQRPIDSRPAVSPPPRRRHDGHVTQPVVALRRPRGPAAVDDQTPADTDTVTLHHSSESANSASVALMLQCCVCLSSVTLCIVAKRCVLEQKLLLTAYRKSYMRNRSVPK